MSIYKKLFAIQMELKAPKDQFNDFGKYSYRSCEGVLEALKPLMEANKLAVILSDTIKDIGGRVYVEAIATAVDIETGESVCVTASAREEESKKGMDASQVTGASSSYARKYALNGLFAIDDNKDSDATNNGEKQPKLSGKPQESKDATQPVKTQETQEKPLYKCEKCGKVLTVYKNDEGKDVSLRKHAEGSMKKFGKVWCIDCINGYLGNGTTA